MPLPDNPICVALDERDPERLRSLADAVMDHCGMLKVGLTAYARNGPEIVRELARVRPVFLDLKLHDIPAQVEGATGVVSELGAEWVTVHASGGGEMIKAAVAGAGPGLGVLAVTVLTSLDDVSLDAIGMRGPSLEAVLRLGEMALVSGADGLVCSPLEVGAVRERFGTRAAGGPALFVPGIRLAESDAGDQRRTLGPGDALDAGADVLVIGRPITAAADPGAAASAIAQGRR